MPLLRLRKRNDRTEAIDSRSHRRRHGAIPLESFSTKGQPSIMGRLYPRNLTSVVSCWQLDSVTGFPRVIDRRGDRRRCRQAGEERLARGNQVEACGPHSVDRAERGQARRLGDLQGDGEG